MTTSEIRELSDFAAGQNQKRLGRVLVKKKATMRRDRRVSKTDTSGRKRSSAISGSATGQSIRGSLASSSGISGSGAGRRTKGSVARSGSMEVHVPHPTGGQGQGHTWWREINWSGSGDSSSAASSSMSGPGAMSLSESELSPQSNMLLRSSDAMDVDSQEESDGDDYMKIDGSRLGLPRTYVVGDEKQRRGLDMSRSVPDKVGTRVSIYGPCAGGYCCGQCGRCEGN